MPTLRAYRTLSPASFSALREPLARKVFRCSKAEEEQGLRSLHITGAGGWAYEDHEQQGRLGQGPVLMDTEEKARAEADNYLRFLQEAIAGFPELHRAFGEAPLVSGGMRFERLERAIVAREGEWPEPRWHWRARYTLHLRPDAESPPAPVEQGHLEIDLAPSGKVLSIRCGLLPILSGPVAHRRFGLLELREKAGAIEAEGTQLAMRPSEKAAPLSPESTDEAGASSAVDVVYRFNPATEMYAGYAPTDSGWVALSEAGVGGSYLNGVMGVWPSQKSIFDLADKFGYESPLGDWLEEGSDKIRGDEKFDLPQLSTADWELIAVLEKLRREEKKALPYVEENNSKKYTQWVFINKDEVKEVEEGFGKAQSFLTKICKIASGIFKENGINIDIRGTEWNEEDEKFFNQIRSNNQDNFILGGYTVLTQGSKDGVTNGGVTSTFFKSTVRYFAIQDYFSPYQIGYFIAHEILHQYLNRIGYIFFGRTDFFSIQGYHLNEINGVKWLNLHTSGDETGYGLTGFNESHTELRRIHPVHKHYLKEFPSLLSSKEIKKIASNTKIISVNRLNNELKKLPIPFLKYLLTYLKVQEVNWRVMKVREDGHPAANDVTLSLYPRWDLTNEINNIRYNLKPPHGATPYREFIIYFSKTPVAHIGFPLDYHWFDDVDYE